jgi:predicted metal-dependent HD superfamily phosphohydrolase
MSDPALQKQWSTLATAVGIEDDGLFDDLITRYSEPHRHYHNVEHLAAVVRHIEKLAAAEKVKDRNPLALAGWFHDAIHDIRSSTNEADSAAFARDELARRGASPVLCERVARLVEMTAHDRPPRDDPAAAVLLDADLAILAAPAEVYDAYVDAIRDEYAFVPEDVFRRGRAVVLRGLMEGSIFSSKSMKPLEEAARKNIERELQALTVSE